MWNRPRNWGHSKKENSSILILDKEIKKLKFKDFYNEHRKFMRIISLDEFYKLFN